MTHTNSTILSSSTILVMIMITMRLVSLFFLLGPTSTFAFVGSPAFVGRRPMKLSESVAGKIFQLEEREGAFVVVVGVGVVVGFVVGVGVAVVIVVVVVVASNVETVNHHTLNPTQPHIQTRKWQYQNLLLMKTTL